MKLLIVGLGSMGKRRARLTKGIDDAIQIIGVDTAEGRRDEEHHAEIDRRVERLRRNDADPGHQQDDRCGDSDPGRVDAM